LPYCRVSQPHTPLARPTQRVPAPAVLGSGSTPGPHTLHRGAPDAPGRAPVPEAHRLPRAGLQGQGRRRRPARRAASPSSSPLAPPLGRRGRAHGGEQAEQEAVLCRLGVCLGHPTGDGTVRLLRAQLRAREGGRGGCTGFGGAGHHGDGAGMPLRRRRDRPCTAGAQLHARGRVKAWGLSRKAAMTQVTVRMSVRRRTDRWPGRAGR
jgi:hypothetical protein